VLKPVDVDVYKYGEEVCCLRHIFLPKKVGRKYASGAPRQQLPCPFSCVSLNVPQLRPALGHHGPSRYRGWSAQ